MNELGVSVKILTGDNEYVSLAVCEKVGLVSDTIILGPEMEKMSRDELSKKIKSTTIFARLTPEQKAEIIDLFKKQGNVVGYLGDGINDAPPLKMSDVGISVKNGSDIARDVADIVLMKKSLEVLKEGIIEGRKTHMNILKYIQMEISSNFGNMVTVAIASFFLPFLPLLPVQILLNNFLYDISQITIPSDNVDIELVKKPKKWDISFIKKFMFLFGSVSSVFDFLTFFVLLGILHVAVDVFRTGWFIESLLTQTLVIFLIRTRVTPFFKSKPGKFIFISAAAVILIGLIITSTTIGKYFAFTPLSMQFYLFIFGIVILYLFCVEFTKYMFFRK
jgi:Mg2+-importing ATPase